MWSEYCWVQILSVHHHSDLQGSGGITARRCRDTNWRRHGDRQPVSQLLPGQGFHGLRPAWNQPAESETSMLKLDQNWTKARCWNQSKHQFDTSLKPVGSHAEDYSKTILKWIQNHPVHTIPLSAVWSQSKNLRNTITLYNKPYTSLLRLVCNKYGTCLNQLYWESKYRQLQLSDKSTELLILWSRHLDRSPGHTGLTQRQTTIHTYRPLRVTES